MKKEVLDIIDYGYNGEGVAKKDGKVFFVPKSIVGEKVEVDIIKENSKLCFCRVSKILESSKDRKFAPCPYFSKCGGCNFQHINYEKEIQIKKDIFAKEFSKIKNLNSIEIISKGNEYGYRNKVRFKVNNKRIGFYSEKSNDFIEVKQCLLISRKMNEMLERINEFLAQSKHILTKL